MGKGAGGAEGLEMRAGCIKETINDVQNKLFESQIELLKARNWMTENKRIDKAGTLGKIY